MAMRHSAQPPVKLVVWKCPTCGVENTGPLEQGCVSCHAGDPKQAVKVEAVPPVGLPDSTGTRLYGPPAPDPREAAHSWASEFCLQVVDARYSQERIAEIAFLAGVEWREKQAAPAGNAHVGVGGTERPEAATQGGHYLIMVPPDADEATVENTPQLDPRAQATIVAALAFYLDNQLGYGAIPGQLTAAECRELIDHLKEPEPTE